MEDGDRDGSGPIEETRSPTIVHWHYKVLPLLSKQGPCYSVRKVIEPYENLETAAFTSKDGPVRSTPPRRVARGVVETAYQYVWHPPSHTSTDYEL